MSTMATTACAEGRDRVRRGVRSEGGRRRLQANTEGGREREERPSETCMEKRIQVMMILLVSFVWHVILDKDRHVCMFKMCV